MRRRVSTLLAVLAVVPLAACAGPGTDAPRAQVGAARSSSAPAASAEPAVAADQEYRFVGTVLQSLDHGPRLCQMVLTSYPPQCGGPDVLGWDWAAVVAEDAGGTTWGEYEVVGTWDGTALTLTRPPGTPPPAPAPDLTNRFAAPCPEPAGGWTVPDPALTTAADLEHLFATASALEGAAGGWTDQRGGADPPVVVQRTTGDVAATEAALRPLWGGSLCVASAERTEAELRSAQEQLSAEAPSRGYTSLSDDVVANEVVVQTWLVKPEDQADLDERFGAGTVGSSARCASPSADRPASPDARGPAPRRCRVLVRSGSGGLAEDHRAVARGGGGAAAAAAGRLVARVRARRTPRPAAPGRCTARRRAGRWLDEVAEPQRLSLAVSACALTVASLNSRSPR